MLHYTSLHTHTHTHTHIHPHLLVTDNLCFFPVTNFSISLLGLTAQGDSPWQPKNKRNGFCFRGINVVLHYTSPHTHTHIHTHTPTLARDGQLVFLPNDKVFNFSLSAKVNHPELLDPREKK